MIANAELLNVSRASLEYISLNTFEDSLGSAVGCYVLGCIRIAQDKEKERQVSFFHL